MRTFLNIDAVVQFVKCEENIDVRVPKIDEKHQRMDRNCQNKTKNWHQFFSIENLGSKIPPYRRSCKEYWKDVSSQVSRFRFQQLKAIYFAWPLFLRVGINHF